MNDTIVDISIPNDGVNPPGVEIEFEIIRDIVRLADLTDDWTALLRGNAEFYLSDSPAWAMTAWRTVCGPRGRQLRVIVGRVSGKVVLVWPLTVGRQGPWRVVRPLNSETSEYSNVVVAIDPRRADWARSAWEYLKQEMDADVATFPYVRETALLDQIIRDEPGRFREFWSSASTTWAAERGWETYYAKLSRNLRSKANQKDRWLRELGALEYSIVERGAEFEHVLEWMLVEKLKWLDRTNQSSPWLHSAAYKRFMFALANEGSGERRLAIFVLKLNGEILAAQMNALDGHHFEVFVGAFSTAMEKYSPGQVLRMHCLRWAADRGLVFDMRVGDEAYKQSFATEYTAAYIYNVPLRISGRAFVGAKKLKSWLTRLRENWRRPA